MWTGRPAAGDIPGRSWKGWGPGGVLVALDWDAEAIERVRERFAEERSRLHLEKASYAELGQVLERLNMGPVDGIVLDLGVSSFQLEDSSRGFSFLPRRAARYAHGQEPSRDGRRPGQFLRGKGIGGPDLRTGRGKVFAEDSPGRRIPEENDPFFRDC